MDLDLEFYIETARKLGTVQGIIAEGFSLLTMAARERNSLHRKEVEKEASRAAERDKKIAATLDAVQRAGEAASASLTEGAEGLKRARPPDGLLDARLPPDLERIAARATLDTCKDPNCPIHAPLRAGKVEATPLTPEEIDRLHAELEASAAGE